VSRSPSRFTNLVIFLERFVDNFPLRTNTRIPRKPLPMSFMVNRILPLHRVGASDCDAGIVDQSRELLIIARSSSRPMFDRILDRNELA
jgi:hypothetical protein